VIRGKVLITGASGLLGRQLLKTFRSSGCESVLGLCHSRPGPDLVTHDLLDAAATRDLVAREKPSHIVHAAAQRFPDKVEAQFEQAQALNITATRVLAEAGRSVGAKIFYISTDYVFDGASPPFGAEDEPRPLNKYGLTKLEGEKEVLAADSDNNVVLRVPVLYGEVETLGESAVTTLLTASRRSGTPAKMSSYEVRCPSHTRDIAEIVRDLVARSEAGVRISGVYQWSGLEKLSKWDMVKVVADVAGLEELGHLEEVKEASPGAPRPRDVEMDRSRLLDLGIKHHTDFREGVREALAKWI